jgi:AcrR family transcriptional regulator
LFGDLERMVGKRRGGWLLDGSGREVAAPVERRDAMRNRERVLGAARALFAEKGVTCVTMEEIARSAGVGKGTLYRRYPHKGLLCQALLDEPTRALQAEVLEVLRDEEDPLEGLRWFLGRLARSTEEHLDLLYGGQEALSGAERLASYSWPSRLWQRWTVLGLLHAAGRGGVLPAGADSAYLADALLAPLSVELYYHQRRVLGLPPERIEAGVVSLVPR